MKILYLTMAEIDPTSGVYKKIISQKNAFKEKNECKILFVKDSGEAVLEDNGAFRKIDLNNSKDAQEVCAYLNECDFCYARFELLRHSYYKKILQECKKKGTGLIIEIPTYPPYQESLARVREKVSKRNYIGALKTLLGTAVVVTDLHRLVKYADVMVLVADDTKFKGTKTIRIENGIDIKNNPFQAEERENSTVINVIAVSNFAVWNGYDRAIKGLGEYYKSTGRDDFHLTFVGDKSKAADLISLAEKEGVSNLISFTGALAGAELNLEYAKADIALGALGNHRRKVFANSSLKAKEYAAQGMIMILSDAEGIEQEIVSNSFVVKSDESPLDFGAILEWYSLLKDKNQIRNEIHAFAEQNYSWNIQMQKVMDAFGDLKRGQNG